jgi:hypothetical protein
LGDRAKWPSQWLAVARQRRGPQRDNQDRGPAGAGGRSHHRAQAVIDGKTCEQSEAANSGQKGDTAGLSMGYQVGVIKFSANRL